MIKVCLTLTVSETKYRQNLYLLNGLRGLWTCLYFISQFLKAEEAGDKRAIAVKQ